jgi:hypothetical protein
LLESRAYPDGSARNLSPKALGVLSSYAWPGNIRELVNVIDFACAVASDPEIGVDDLPDQVFRRMDDDDEASAADAARSNSKQAASLREDLRRADWNISAAARLLGVDRTTLHRRMRRLGVTLPPRSAKAPLMALKKTRSGIAGRRTPGRDRSGASDRFRRAEVQAVTDTLAPVWVRPVGTRPNKEPDANRDISPTGDGAAWSVPARLMSPEKDVERKTGAPTSRGTFSESPA